MEAAPCQRSLLFAGAVARPPPDGRLPKRLMLGEFVGGGRVNPGQEIPAAELAYVHNGRRQGVQGHARLHFRAVYLRSPEIDLDGRGSGAGGNTVARGGAAGSFEVHDLLAQGGRGRETTTSCQARQRAQKE